MSARYGAILTPDGDMVISFGYGRSEFTRAIRHALKIKPSFAWPTEAEKKILTATKQKPNDWKAQRARLLTELLEFEAAEDLVGQVLKQCKDQKWLARARYLGGHIACIKLPKRNRNRAIAAFAALDNLPAELRDDVVADRYSLRIHLRRRGSFFRGRELRPREKLLPRKRACHASSIKSVGTSVQHTRSGGWGLVSCDDGPIHRLGPLPQPPLPRTRVRSSLPRRFWEGG